MGPDCPNTLTHADVTRFPPSLCRYESDKPVKAGHLLLVPLSSNLGYNAMQAIDSTMDAQH
jgi:hypothetical protein